MQRLLENGTIYFHCHASHSIDRAALNDDQRKYVFNQLMQELGPVASHVSDFNINDNLFTCLLGGDRSVKAGRGSGKDHSIRK